MKKPKERCIIQIWIWRKFAWTIRRRAHVWGVLGLVLQLRLFRRPVELPLWDRWVWRAWWAHDISQKGSRVIPLTLRQKVMIKVRKKEADFLSSSKRQKSSIKKLNWGQTKPKKSQNPAILKRRMMLSSMLMKLKSHLLTRFLSAQSPKSWQVKILFKSLLIAYLSSLSAAKKTWNSPGTSLRRRKNLIASFSRTSLMRAQTQLPLRKGT